MFGQLVNKSFFFKIISVHHIPHFSNLRLLFSVLLPVTQNKGNGIYKPRWEVVSSNSQSIIYF